MFLNSPGVKISERQRKSLSDQVKDCLFFTPHNLDSAKVLGEGIVRFESQSFQGKSIPLSKGISLQLIYMGDLFDKAIDLVIEKAVDASIFAFLEAPLNYRKCLLHYAETINQDIVIEDPVLKLGLPKYYNSDLVGIRTIKKVEKEIGLLIGDDLENLSINCKKYVKSTKKHDRLSLYTLGTYSYSKNMLNLYPLPTLIIAGAKSNQNLSISYMSRSKMEQRTLMAKSDFIVAISLESMIHELSHLLFKCEAEHQIKNHLLDQETQRLANMKGVSVEEAKKDIAQYIKLGFGESISNILLAYKDLDGLMSHAIRFKLGLLYLLSTPSSIQLIRKSFVPTIIEKIQSSQILKFNYSYGEIEIDTPYVKTTHKSKHSTDFSVVDKSSILDIQYDWEKPVSDVYQYNTKLTFRSEIVMTDDLEKTLEKKRSRSNYAKTNYQFIEKVDLADDDLLFAFEGNANILSIPFLEDPLDFLLQLVNRQELMSSRNAGIGESAGLYMMFDNDEMRIKLVYSPDAETFFEITTGEAWFILSL
mgnify:CR=1 FL=1|tara:strand:- start:229 stop:1824 length:1596 start_codon:yes stop_codon:yes gene_type:complete